MRAAPTAASHHPPPLSTTNPGTGDAPRSLPAVYFQFPWRHLLPTALSPQVIRSNGPQTQELLCPRGCLVVFALPIALDATRTQPAVDSSSHFPYPHTPPPPRLFLLPPPHSRSAPRAHSARGLSRQARRVSLPPPGPPAISSSSNALSYRDRIDHDAPSVHASPPGGSGSGGGDGGGSGGGSFDNASSPHRGGDDPPRRTSYRAGAPDDGDDRRPLPRTRIRGDVDGAGGGDGAGEWASEWRSGAHGGSRLGENEAGGGASASASAGADATAGERRRRDLGGGGSREEDGSSPPAAHRASGGGGSGGVGVREGVKSRRSQREALAEPSGYPRSPLQARSSTATAAAPIPAAPAPAVTAPDDDAAAQRASLQQELRAQIDEKKRRQREEREAAIREDLRLLQQQQAYNPFGKVRRAPKPTAPSHLSTPARHFIPTSPLPTPSIPHRYPRVGLALPCAMPRATSSRN